MPQNNSGGTLPTSSDGNNGLNVRPNLLPESFLFIEKGQFSQAQSDKFGIVGNTFRTTSRIGYSGKIFTICQGQILIQPNSENASKVNVILKPFNQPIKGLAIKYFIYRGLNKSDFFNDSNQTINANDSNATGFVKQIREDFQKLYNMLNVNPAPTLTAQYIGYPGTGSYAQNTDLLIDDFFFKISQEDAGSTPANQKAFELPMIPRGTHLGTVSGSQSIGIDIVLNEGDYTIENDPNPFKLDLNFARLNNHILNPDAEPNTFKKKLIKETATQFIDIAAFYGLHTHGKGKLHASSGGQNTVLQTNDEIYDAIKDFVTANTTYLYIQGSRQRSYNFYGNHNIGTTTNSYKQGTTVTNLAVGNFAEHWPLQEFSNIPSLAIQLTTDNNDAAALYVKQGILNVDTLNEDNFIRGENLLQQADANNTIDTEFTKPIVFDIKKAGSNNIASFVQLIYEGKALEIMNAIPPLEPDEKLYLKDIDDVFGLINVTPHIQTKPNTSELAYVIDQNLLLIDFDNKTGGRDIATVTTKRVEDQIMKNDTENLRRVTYETLLNNIRQSVGGLFESRSAYQDNSNNGTITYSDKMNNFYQLEKPYYLQAEQLITTDGAHIVGVLLNADNLTLPSKKIAGITETENNKIKLLISEKQLNNPKFYFKNILGEETSYFESAEGHQYKKYLLGVIGESQEGQIIAVFPTDTIYVITLDNLAFTSEEYAKWMPSNTDINKDIINLKII